jgi:hypothetical protein
MLAYTVLKRELLQRGHVVQLDERPAALPLWARVAAGASANVVSWGVMYPVELVRNVQQAHAAADPTGARSPPSALTCVRELVREGGVQRLYRGWLLTILRAGPVAGIILPSFEIVLPWLERRL